MGYCDLLLLLSLSSTHQCQVIVKRAQFRVYLATEHEGLLVIEGALLLLRLFLDCTVALRFDVPLHFAQRLADIAEG